MELVTWISFSLAYMLTLRLAHALTSLLGLRKKDL